jgi:hypothetical protein
MGRCDNLLCGIDAATRLRRLLALRVESWVGVAAGVIA